MFLVFVLNSPVLFPYLKYFYVILVRKVIDIFP